uniref:Uncharacterized protein n=1 Tax=Anopheles stephensi TaxID=30069 RepID=A0A182YRL0_ANOST
MCKIHEAASEHKQLFEKSEAQSLNSVELHDGSKDVAAIQRSDFHNVSCFNCGQAYNGRHRRYCPAKNVNCNNCGRRGHFKKFCKAAKNNNTTGVPLEATEKNVHMIAWSESGFSSTNIGTTNMYCIWVIETFKQCGIFAIISIRNQMQTYFKVWEIFQENVL